MPKKPEKIHRILGSLAFVLNVYLRDEGTSKEKLDILDSLNKAYESFKNVFCKEQPTVARASQMSPRSAWYSPILTGYIKETGERSFCKNLARITEPRNWLVDRNPGFSEHHTQQLADAASVLIKLKRYLDVQQQRIYSIPNLKSVMSLPPPTRADKSVQCSKSTEFLKDSSDQRTRFVSPSVRAISADDKQACNHRLEDYETFDNLTYDKFSQPRLHSSRLSLRRRKAEICPECRESRILASVKRRIEEDLDCDRSSSYVTACESLDSFRSCRLCEEMRRLHRHHCCCYYSPKRPCYSIDSGIDLVLECDKEVQATPSHETISSSAVDGAVRKITEDLILCERRARENLTRKKLRRSLTPTLDRSHLRWSDLKNSSEDELITDISTPSLVSLSDLEEDTI